MRMRTVRCLMMRRMMIREVNRGIETRRLFMGGLCFVCTIGRGRVGDWILENCEGRGGEREEGGRG